MYMMTHSLGTALPHSSVKELDLQPALERVAWVCDGTYTGRVVWVARGYESIAEFVPKRRCETSDMSVKPHNWHYMESQWIIWSHGQDVLGSQRWIRIQNMTNLFKDFILSLPEVKKNRRSISWLMTWWQFHSLTFSFSEAFVEDDRDASALALGAGVSWDKFWAQNFHLSFGTFVIHITNAYFAINSDILHIV